MNDLQTAFDAGFDAIKGYVDRSLATIHKRLKDLEARLDADQPATRLREMEDRLVALEASSAVTVKLARPVVRVKAGAA